MKKIILKAIMSISIASILGCMCGLVVYKIYFTDNMLSYENNTIYLLESGEYSSYDNMRANTISNNYIYYEEDNLYKTVLGITTSLDNIDKIKNIYDNNLIVSSYYCNDNTLNSKLIEYDKKLINTTNEEEIKGIIIDMLNLYKNDDKVKLTKIS